MLLEIFALLFTLALFIWSNGVAIENRLSKPSIPALPFIPGGTARKLLGNVPRDQAMENLVALCPNLDEHGMFGFQLFFHNFVFVTDREKILEVVTNTDDFPKSKTNNLMDFLFGDSVFYTNGDVWQKHHRVLQSSFAQNKFTALIASSFESLTRHWDSILPQEGSTSLVVHDWVGKTVFQTLGLFAYGYDYRAIDQESEPFNDYVELIQKTMTESKLVHYANIHLKNLTSIAYFKRFYELRNKVYAHFQDLIDRRRAALAEMTEDEMKELKDILARVLINKPEYDDKSIAEDLMTMFFAGHDTTAASISFALYLLAKNPQFQARAHEEAKRFMETFDAEEELTDSQLRIRMPYIYAVMLETWRILPPAAGTLTRVVANENVSIGGQHIPKGTKVLTSIVSAHHTKKVWGDDADVFDPSRFFHGRNLDGSIDTESAKKLITFSAGPRACLGTRFATIQVFLGLARILGQFHFEMPEHSPHAERCQVRPFIAVMAPINMHLLVSRI